MKIGHTFDFSPKRIAASNAYLGQHLDADTAGMALTKAAGVFFLREASDSTNHPK